MDQSGDSPPPLLPHQHHRNNTVVKGLALPRTLSSRHRLGHVYLPTGYGPKKMAAAGMGPRAFAASCAFALVSFARASGVQEGQGLQIGLLVALGECHGAEVRVLR